MAARRVLWSGLSCRRVALGARALRGVGTASRALPPLSSERSARADDGGGEAGGAGGATAAALHPLVHRLNTTLEDYPIPSFVGFIGLSYGVFGASFVVLNTAGFDMPALAVAGAVSRLTRWFKKPVDVALTLLLARAFPASTAIKLGPLIVPQLPREESRPDATAAGDGGGGLLLARWADFATRWLEGPVNRYGAPFMLARWITGLSLVTLTTTVVHAGVDITAVLAPVFSDTQALAAVSGTASALAGAMVTNTLSLPLRVLLFAQLARPLFVAMRLTPVTHASTPAVPVAGDASRAAPPAASVPASPAPTRS
ncbi:hypothetical protein KFE25_005588 [Diacronema lutheri]|uniref:Uncharacterized protein n=1 Tax=Diacronema lutheri TaxID=2081491 RepID=A0A8J5XJT9_DIALT|nr:hypothetical protein KFE25_005588 [Diacronema lutheri]